MIADIIKCPIHLASDHFHFSRYFPWQRLLGNSIGMRSPSSNQLFCYVVPANLQEHAAPSKSIRLIRIGRESLGTSQKLAWIYSGFQLSGHCRDDSASLRIPLNIAEGTFLFNILSQAFHPQQEPAMRTASLKQARLFLIAFLFLVQPSFSSSCRRM